MECNVLASVYLTGREMEHIFMMIRTSPYFPVIDISTKPRLPISDFPLRKGFKITKRYLVIKHGKLGNPLEMGLSLGKSALCIYKCSIFQQAMLDDRRVYHIILGFGSKPYSPGEHQNSW